MTAMRLGIKPARLVELGVSFWRVVKAALEQARRWLK